MANNFVRRSALTDKLSSMMIDVSYAQVMAWEEGGELIKNALPSHLTADEREFLTTGITPKELADICGPWEEEPPCEGELKLNGKN